MNRQLSCLLRYTVFALVLGAMFASHAVSAEKPMVPTKDGFVEARGMLSGNLRVDLFGLKEMPPVLTPVMLQDATPVSARKSPWLAGGLSLLVPGAGEFYAESYWKSAAFLAIEITAWALAYSFDKRGDRQTDSYHDYANSHWDVARYAQWTLDNATVINPGVDIASFLGPGGVFVNGRVSWSRLNQLESALGNWYSHNLPPYGDQQYYELIGKYPQFNQGWDDANLTLPGDYDVVKANLTTRYLFYSRERGKANDYYDNASTFVTVAVVNHVLSAIDAAWSAGSYNRVHAEMGMQRVPVGGYYAHVPVVKVRYGF